MKEVAKITDAQFYRATDSKSLEQIFADIDKPTAKKKLDVVG